jgi:NAD(P)H-hydrate repair Nnr-like enzyme with NAD(P)H-hydrate dehydratase domain
MFPLHVQGSVDIIAASSTGTASTTTNTSTTGNTTDAAGSGDVVYVVQAKGAPRRCGGLGDILSGTTATALHWALEVIHLYC